MMDMSQMTNHEEFIPYNCVNWFDGCNSCGSENGRLTYCTEMACHQYTEPFCKAYEKSSVSPSEPVEDPNRYQDPMGDDVVTPVADDFDYAPERPVDCLSWDDVEGVCLGYGVDLPDEVDIVRPGAPAEVLPIMENGELIEPKASLWGLIKYHLFGWMK